MKTSSEEATSRELVQLLKPPVKCEGSPFSNSRTRTVFLSTLGANTTTELTARQTSQNQIELGSFLGLLRQYLTDAEAVDILREFRKSGRWQGNKQVLWTGMNQETVQKWADEHDFVTLTTALGRLKDVTCPDCLRRVKSDKAWSKYMKGASALFALCIAQREHGSVLLVTPPPGERFNPQGGTNFQLIEAPILAGLWGPSYLERIDMVHPHVDLARDYQYQFWPRDEVDEWTAIFEHSPRNKVVWRAVKRSSLPASFGNVSSGSLGRGVVRPSEEARLEQSRRDKQKHQERMHELELRQQAVERERLAQSARDKKRHQVMMYRLEVEQQARERERLAQLRRDEQPNEAQRDWVWRRAPVARMKTPARNRESEDARRAKVIQLFADLVLAVMADGSEDSWK